jgi:hypothetical protein
MERYACKSEWKYSEVFRRTECVQTAGVNLMVRDIEMGTGARTYQVRWEGRKEGGRESVRGRERGSEGKRKERRV